MKKLTFLNLEQTEQLQEKLDLHARFSNISFSFSRISDQELTVAITQEKSFHQNHFDQKKLREIAHETLGNFIFDRKLHVMANIYKPSPADVVDDAWIREKQLKYGVKNKDLVVALGVDKTSISAYTGGLKPLSAPVKAMFYYYFECLESKGNLN